MEFSVGAMMKDDEPLWRVGLKDPSLTATAVWEEIAWTISCPPSGGKSMRSSSTLEEAIDA